MKSQWGYVALLPLISCFVWLGMLMGMLIYWCTSGRPHYPSMESHQHIPFISDVGAYRLKPLFISASAVMVVTLDLGFMAERWLRHDRRRLAPNKTSFQKGVSIASIVFAIIGAIGLILLTIFDTYRHNHVHHICLGLFICGYILSAICACIEYQRLAIHYRQFTVFRLSFWTKLAFIIIEIVLAIIFVATNTGHHHHHSSAAAAAATGGNNGHKRDVSAGVEWTIAFIFTLYSLSYLLDLLPAIHSRKHPAQAFALDNVAGVSHHPNNNTIENDNLNNLTSKKNASLPNQNNNNNNNNSQQNKRGFLAWLSRAKRGWPDFSG